MSNTPSYVIIGAAGGIGTELCTQLARRSPCKLFLAGRNASKLEALEGTLRANHPEVEIHNRPVDATNSSAVDALFTEANNVIGPLSGAVNLCGSIVLKPAHLTSDQEFADTLAINLLTAFHVLRAAGPVAGDDLVARAVEAHRAAEGDVHVQRQRPRDAAHVAPLDPRLVGLGVERLDEAVGRGGLAQQPE